MNKWIFLCLAVVSEVIGTSALKQSEGFTKLWPSLMVLVGFGFAFYFLSITLKVIPIGIAYAIWSGLGIVLISLIGWFWFGQKLDAAAIAGIALIGAGVLVMNLFSNSIAH
ncbi:SMR family transporter [Leucothrix pacifica]|uniref:QacE family quaternary ammonium compound efflux SMR transporter n=1 Tax=Leucothrix pacifica TaxID=1247513 RepID=A0A317CGR0_9GAMM|nr:SMR family transporter [Leucothrix pacifica]PWQ97745.1 QacE family quaternary ammonium compound efflux SMR transporter [Leucothrix pacifica]